MQFAEAVLHKESAALAEVRDRLVATMGSEALVDTAAVVGLFNAIDRVADATGTPLEQAKAEASAEVREAIGINAFRKSREALERSVSDTITGRAGTQK